MPLLLKGSSAKEGEVEASSAQVAGTGSAPMGGRREVVCFDCRTVSKASAKATSTQCSHCGTFIDLRDFEIRDRSTQRIRTRGNVTIFKKGVLLGTAVHCGNLLVEGAVSGSIYAQEVVEFRADAKVLGEIRCRHLIVERRNRVTGLQPIHLESMELQGFLTGRVFVSGLSHLGKHGRFEGGLTTRLLKVEPGGELEGPIRAGGQMAGHMGAEEGNVRTESGETG